MVQFSATAEARVGVMGIEDGGLVEAIVEDASDVTEDEGPCPCCHELHWLRVIAAYARGACWVIYCGNCGKPIEERWSILP